VAPLSQHWTFAGRFLDEETGFYYYRARTYDPATGRFLQRGPLGYADSPVLHEHVHSRPTQQTDPLGLSVGEASHPLLPTIGAAADCDGDRSGMPNVRHRTSRCGQWREGRCEVTIEGKWTWVEGSDGNRVPVVRRIRQPQDLAW
jgi:RHS repeat-associated protein